MDQLVQQALKQYRDEFGEDFDPTWNPTSEEELAEKLRSSQSDFNKWRSKNGRVWKTLTAIALPISNLGKIASAAAEATFPPAAAGVAGLLSLVTACEKVSAANDFLEQMFTKLDDVLSRWKIDLRHNVDEYMKDKMRQILLLLLSIIARSQKVMGHGRARRWLAGVAFGDDRKTADLIEELETLLQSEDRTRMALTLDKISALWEKAIRTENAAVVEKLDSPSVTINEAAYAYRLEEKIVDTGLWLMEDTLCQSWINKETPLLMVLGGPGSGKSYLATTLIEDMIQKRLQKDTKSDIDAIAYYYFDQESTLLKMFTTMAYQLQKADPEYRQHVVQMFDQGDFRTAKEAWTKLFLEYWNTDVGQGAILVIDGLSEATPEEIELFAEMVKEMMKAPGYKIRVAIFGLIQIWGEFDYVAQEGFIEITSKRNNPDIAAYVDRELSKHRQLKKSKPEVRDEIRDRILEQCDGVFEWARLLLGKCKTQDKTGIRKLLDQPPPSLDQMVKSCFDQIMNDEDLDTEVLRTLLTLLTYEKWPLRFGQIYHMIQIITGEEHAFLWWNIVRKLSSIIRWRTSRTRRVDSDDEDHIEILDEEKGWSDQTSRTWITFANANIRNYVIRQSKIEFRSDNHMNKWPPPAQKSEAQMVITCIRVLQDKQVVERKNWFLLVYPLRLINLHLKTLDLETVDLEDKLEIVAGIIWMLHDEEGLRRVVLRGPVKLDGGLRAFWRIWFETKEHSIVIQSWLRWALDANFDTDEDTKTWMEAATTSRKALFAPLARFSRRSWLDADWSPKPFDDLKEFENISRLAIVFLVTYDNMDEQEEIPERYQTYVQVLTFGPAVKDIMNSAEKMELPHHGNFYIGLSFAFKVIGRSRKALECIEAVPEDDTSAWAKAWFRSTAYQGQRDFDQAEFFAKKALELNPHGRNEMEGAIPIYRYRKGDLSGALNAARTNYERDPRHVTNQLSYLRCSYMCKEYMTTMKIIRQLDGWTMPDSPVSHLISLLIENKGGVSTALRAMGQAHLFTDSSDDRLFIEKVLDRTTQAIAQSEGEARQIDWQDELASFHFRYLRGGIKTSLRIRLANLSRMQDTKLMPDKVEKEKKIIATRVSCAFALHRLAYEQEANNDSELETTLETFRGLVDDAEKVDRSTLSAVVAMNANYAGFYYGKWLRDHKDGGSWKKHFRQPLLSYLDMLDDKHDHNDLWGLLYAAATLRMAGYRDDALSLTTITLYWQLLREPGFKGSQPMTSNSKENSDKDKSSEGYGNTGCRGSHSLKGVAVVTEALSSTHIDDTQHHQDSQDSSHSEEETLAMSIDRDLGWSCGTCYVYARIDTEMYMCSICNHNSCERCLPKTQLHPTLGYACGSYHRFDRVWPVSEEVMNRAAVIKDGVIHLKKSWLENMRAQWDEKVDE